MNYLDRSACSNGWVGAEGETVSRAGELRSALDLKTFKKKKKKKKERKNKSDRKRNDSFE